MARPRKSKLSHSIVSQPPEGDIKSFWDSQAQAFGPSDLATNPDQHYRKLEIECILRAISNMPHETILDVGCGNGYTTRQIAKKFPEAMITGVDFSEAMIEETVHNVVPNSEFFVADVLSLSRNKHLIGMQFDVVVCTRCLINLANWEEQKIGILQMHKMLKPGGKLIMVENIDEGLNNLNAIRAKIGLEPITERWHNKYLPNAELGKFLVEISRTVLMPEYVENIGNMYYLASRVIYAKLCKDQGIEPDYSNPINAIASQMPTMGEHYACSPNFLFVLGEASHETRN